MKINYRGQTVEAEKMTFEPIEEKWSHYKLGDGTIIKMKLVVSDVFKLSDKDPVTGTPQFLVRSSNVVSVESAGGKSDVH